MRKTPNSLDWISSDFEIGCSFTGQGVSGKQTYFFITLASLAVECAGTEIEREWAQGNASDYGQRV